jgi:protein-disulfide isomerase
VIKKLELKCKIIKVDDMEDIMQYDIMATPALVIDEKVIIVGRIPNQDEIKNILTNRK